MGAVAGTGQGRCGEGGGEAGGGNRFKSGERNWRVGRECGCEESWGMWL